MVVAPSGRPPPGGRPVVAGAHPTTGVVERARAVTRRGAIPDDLRPARHGGPGRSLSATDILDWARQGRTPTSWASAARAVRDRTRRPPDPRGVGGARFVVWGHSQGGQAALTAYAFWPGTMRRTLTLLGVAAAAPATDLAALLDADLSSPAGKNLAAMTLWSWSRVYGAPISQVVEASAMPAVDRLARACIRSIHDVLERRRLSRGIAASFLSVLRPLSTPALGEASGPQHARPPAGRSAGLPGPGRRRQARAAPDHPRLRPAPLRRRQRGDAADLAQDQARLHRRQGRQGCRRLDGRPLRRCPRTERVRLDLDGSPAGRAYRTVFRRRTAASFLPPIQGGGRS